MEKAEEQIKILTKDEIVEKLKNMNVDNKKIFPIHTFSFIVINPDYNPEKFSQEIEDSEEEIDTYGLMLEEIKKPGFDLVWHDTTCNVPRNSEKWLKNHSKICKAKFMPFKFWESCINYCDGTRNYYSEEILNKILEIGDIINFW